MTTDSLAPGLRAAVAELNARGASGLDGYFSLYDDDVFFRDPMQSIRGRARLEQSTRRLIGRTRSFRFELHELVEQEGQLFVSWTMDITPRLGPSFSVEGVTYARARGGKIVEQRDYWDLLGSVLETLPLAGLVYRAILSRLA